MSERPTPEEIITEWGPRGAVPTTDALAAHGYVIVHDDDQRRIIRAAWAAGAEDPAPYYWEGGKGFDDDLCPYDEILGAGVREGTG